jgi:DNA-3-methyladenine glycosylase I
MSSDLIHHPDGRCRCWWPGSDPLYVAYHDTEWGVPERDDRALFEKLILDGFQAGLSWITILRKRDAFRRAFGGFDPAVVARFTPAHVEALMLDAGIVRNRAKIEGTIAGARAFLAIQEREGFGRFLWGFVDGRPVQNALRSRAEAPAETEVSRRISKALKAEGFAFCGPTIVYAFMQAVGMVNDHLVGCFRHADCAVLAEGPNPSGQGASGSACA